MKFKQLRTRRDWFIHHLLGRYLLRHFNTRIFWLTSGNHGPYAEPLRYRGTRVGMTADDWRATGLFPDLVVHETFQEAQKAIRRWRGQE
ncbi:MAG: hypothetical protein WC381_11650 [Kiritimatiellia bacterium]|jgi:hypothetical protein